MKIAFAHALLLFVASGIAHAQNTDELDRRNGFKTIKLGSAVDTLRGAIFKKDLKEKDEFPVRLYAVEDDALKTIGEVHVKDIHVMAYDKLIYKIIVITENDARVMRALEKAFGSSTFVRTSGKYQWGTELLSLTIKPLKNNIELTYRSNPVIRKMYADKGKKIDDIGRDF